MFLHMWSAQRVINTCRHYKWAEFIAVLLFGGTVNFAWTINQTTIILIRGPYFFVVNLKPKLY